MSPLDYVVIALLAAWLVLAVRQIVKSKKKGCGGCTGACSSCAYHGQCDIQDHGDRQNGSVSEKKNK